MTNDIKVKPILFSAEMVNAILEGRKTQTRRIVKPPRWSLKDEIYLWGGSPAVPDDDQAAHFIKCPYGKKGDLLYVRENFFHGLWMDDDVPMLDENDQEMVQTWYKADKREQPLDADGDLLKVRWKPSIHMPRKYSRITLEVQNIRVEKLNNISEEDSQKEGICYYGQSYKSSEHNPMGWGHTTAKSAFELLWNSINKNWDDNPWVWVVDFYAHKCNVDDFVKENKLAA